MPNVTDLCERMDIFVLDGGVYSFSMGHRVRPLHPTPPELASRLRTLIRESGVTLRQLAAITGIPRSTLARIVADGRIWADDLVAICAALSVSPSALLGDTPPASLAEAVRIAEMLSPLTDSERYALRSVIEAAVELRTAAVAEDRRHAGR